MLPLNGDAGPARRAGLSGPRGELDRTWRNWTGDQFCHPASVVAPTTVDEVATALAHAGERDWNVRVTGAGHSFSDVVLTDGMLLSLDRMNRVLDVDSSSGLVRVEAGITLNALSEALAGDYATRPQESIPLSWLPRAANRSRSTPPRVKTHGVRRV